jgi:hypothetical protein
VWKKAAGPILYSSRLHSCLGIAAKSLMEHALSERTDSGAFRRSGAGFRVFWAISAGFLTGFSAGSPEN